MASYSKRIKKVGKSINSIALLAKDIKATVSGEVSNYDLLKDRIAELFDKLMDFRQDIIALTEKNTFLLEDNRALKKKELKLKKKIDQFKNFDADAAKYEAVSIGPDTHVYALKQVESAGTQRTYYCYSCFEKRKKSALQFNRYEHNTNVLICNECGAEIFKREEGRDDIYTAPTSRKSIWDT